MPLIETKEVSIISKSSKCHFDRTECLHFRKIFLRNINNDILGTFLGCKTSYYDVCVSKPRLNDGDEVSTVAEG